MALATPIREARLSSTEEVIPGRATDLLHERGSGQAEPTVTDVLAVIEKGPDTLRPAARASTAHRYHGQVADMVLTLDLPRTGTLAGYSTAAPRSRSTLNAPAASVDISAVRARGRAGQTH